MKKLVLQNQISTRKQVVEHFQLLIRSGALPPGSKLPTQMQLARELKVSDTTIHFAFQDLIKDGLVHSGRGCGTFVAPSIPGLDRIAIYYADDALANPEAHYLRMVHKTLVEECSGHGIAVRMFHDQRPVSQIGTPMEELQAAVEAHEVQAIIAPSADSRLIRWLGKLDIPFAAGTSHRAPYSVAYDLNNFVDLAVAEVRKAGCRSIGLISPLPTRFTDVVAEGDHDWVSFNRRFIECAGEHGLTIREGWIREPIGHNKPEPTGHQYGYEQALALLALKQRPEGIVVFPDTVARGVITALLADHERAASMTLVAHKLKEIPLICPLPARFVINEASAVAKSLLEMAERQFRGEQPNGPVRLPFHLDQNT